MSVLRRLTIRARITLGTLLVATIGIAGVAIVLHAQFRDIVVRSEQTLAAGDLAPFVTDIRSGAGERPDQPSDGVLVLIVDPGGRSVVDTLPHDIGEFVARDAAGLRPGGSTGVTTDEGERFTVVHETASTGEGTWQLWAARSGAASDLTVGELDRTLVIASAVLIAIFGAAAWLLAAVVLRPVTRMRRTARELGDRPGSGELPVGPADDELADLARVLNQFIARLRDTAERERALLSAASHEIRTPLAVLTTRLELAHRHTGDAGALEHEIREAERSLERLTSLAGSLLELSRLDSGTGDETTTTAGELEADLLEAVDRTRMLTAHGGVRIEFDTDIPRPDVRYRIASLSFVRILDNLTSNAREATPAHGSIELSLKQRASTLLLSVRDTGRGIPEDFIPRAFDRFSRPDEARAARDGGSGLGLALVDALTRAAGGRVTIGNRDGGGVEVAVELPPADGPARSEPGR